MAEHEDAAGLVRLNRRIGGEERLLRQLLPPRQRGCHLAPQIATRHQLEGTIGEACEHRFIESLPELCKLGKSSQARRPRQGVHRELGSSSQAKASNQGVLRKLHSSWSRPRGRVQGVGRTQGAGGRSGQVKAKRAGAGCGRGRRLRWRSLDVGGSSGCRAWARASVRGLSWTL